MAEAAGQPPQLGIRIPRNGAEPEPDITRAGALDRVLPGPFPRGAAGGRGLGGAAGGAVGGGPGGAAEGIVDGRFPGKGGAGTLLDGPLQQRRHPRGIRVQHPGITPRSRVPGRIHLPRLPRPGAGIGEVERQLAVGDLVGGADSRERAVPQVGAGGVSGGGMVLPVRPQRDFSGFQRCGRDPGVVFVQRELFGLVLDQPGEAVGLEIARGVGPVDGRRDGGLADGGLVLNADITGLLPRGRQRGPGPADKLRCDHARTVASHPGGRERTDELPKRSAGPMGAPRDPGMPDAHLTPSSCGPHAAGHPTTTWQSRQSGFLNVVWIGH